VFLPLSTGSLPLSLLVSFSHFGYEFSL
jgi:hypothetical protein